MEVEASMTVGASTLISGIKFQTLVQFLIALER